MRKIISFKHVSLDGFVAGPNGELDWATVNQEIFDYVGDRISKGDTAMYGRVTYEMMENYWPTAADKPTATKHEIEHSKWYKDVRKIVISKTMQGQSINNTEIISANLSEGIHALNQEDGNEILVFGSPSASDALVSENLIDGYWLFVSPIILGQGIPLFSGKIERTKLKLLSTHQFDCGVVELNYEVDRS